MKLRCKTDELKNLTKGRVYEVTNFDLRASELILDHQFPLNTSDLRDNFYVFVIGDSGRKLKLLGRNFEIVGEEYQKKNYRKQKSNGMRLNEVFGPRSEARVRKILELTKRISNDKTNFKTSEVFRLMVETGIISDELLKESVKNITSLPQLTDRRLRELLPLLEKFRRSNKGNVMSNCGTDGYWGLSKNPGYIGVKILMLLMEIRAIMIRSSPTSENKVSCMVAITHIYGSDWVAVVEEANEDFINEWQYIKWFNSNSHNDCYFMYRIIQKEEEITSNNRRSEGAIREEEVPDLEEEGDYIEDEEDNEEEEF